MKNTHLTLKTKNDWFFTINGTYYYEKLETTDVNLALDVLDDIKTDLNKIDNYRQASHKRTYFQDNNCTLSKIKLLNDYYHTNLVSYTDFSKPYGDYNIDIYIPKDQIYDVFKNQQDIENYNYATTYSEKLRKLEQMYFIIWNLTKKPTFVKKEITDKNKFFDTIDYFTCQFWEESIEIINQSILKASMNGEYKVQIDLKHSLFNNENYDAYYRYKASIIRHVKRNFKDYQIEESKDTINIDWSTVEPKINKYEIIDKNLLASEASLITLIQHNDTYRQIQDYLFDALLQRVLQLMKFYLSNSQYKYTVIGLKTIYDVIKESLLENDIKEWSIITNRKNNDIINIAFYDDLKYALRLPLFYKLQTYLTESTRYFAENVNPDSTYLKIKRY